MVGTFGITRLRVVEVTARARAWPFCASGKPVAPASIIICTLPAARSGTAGALPR